MRVDAKVNPSDLFIASAVLAGTILLFSLPAPLQASASEYDVQEGEKQFRIGTEVLQDATKKSGTFTTRKGVHTKTTTRRDGSVVSYTYYVDMKGREVKHGKYTKTYKDGRTVKEEWSYEDGTKHGSFRTYYEDGALHKKGEQKRGKKHGPTVSYREDGSLFKVWLHDQAGKTICEQVHYPDKPTKLRGEGC